MTTKRAKGRRVLLTSLKEILGDGQWHYLTDIARQTGHPITGLSSSVRSLRMPKYGGYIIRYKMTAEQGPAYQMTHALEVQTTPAPRAHPRPATVTTIGGQGATTMGQVIVRPGGDEDTEGDETHRRVALTQLQKHKLYNTILAHKDEIGKLRIDQVERMLATETGFTLSRSIVINSLRDMEVSYEKRPRDEQGYVALMREVGELRKEVATLRGEVNALKTALGVDKPT